MEKLYYYLKTAEKVYLVDRRRYVKWWHVIFDLAILMFVIGMYRIDTIYKCYLVKFDNRWEIVVTKKGIVTEILRLKSKFTLTSRFNAGEYKYKVYKEITDNLLNYIG